MRISPRPRPAWALVALLIALDLGSLALRWRMRSDPRLADRTGPDIAGPMVAFLVAATVGVLVLRRQPGNANGRVLLGLATLFSIGVAADSYAPFALLRPSGTLWGGTASAWVSRWWWIPAFALIGMLLLLFPDGRPPGRFWRLVGGSLLAGTALLMASFPFVPGPLDDGLESLRNPLGAPPGWLPVLRLVSAVGYVLLLGGMVLAAASLVARWRQGDAARRQQLKWVALAASIEGLSLVLHGLFGQSPSVGRYVSLLGDVALALLFAAIGLAILRHRMYDVDLVINRAVVYACLAVFVTGAYVGIVVGFGQVLRRRAEPDLALSVLATAIVAIAFAPVRERARRFANRLVYGERQAPYDVLADLGYRLAPAVSTEDLLPGMARSAAAGVGAHAAEVRLELLDGSQRRAAWPPGSAGSYDGGQVFAVVHHGAEIGGITVVPRPGVPLTSQQLSLLSDLAGQAALALHNIRLTLQLRDQLARVSAQAAELRASRQRLVTAQDDERRRLERDIHDGVQQQLVAVTLRLRTTARQAPESTAESLEEIRAQVTDILVTLRDLARGIFPPLLAEAGLGPALAAHITKTRAAARLADHLPAGLRAAPEVEAAVYFCCLEALQNVSKHAGPGATARVALDLDEGVLGFVVSDDGPGFASGATAGRGSGLQGMADRLAAVGGRLDVAASPGAGTRVAGFVPLTPR